MSLPPINPNKSNAGIALDPRTLERVIPESKRPDGTVRKQIKIRPGFTPQEDVRRFRGTKQAQMDTNTLPKGHIIGWAPPPTSTSNSAGSGDKPLSKSAKKNMKRKEAAAKKKDVEVPDNWDDDDDDEEKKSDKGKATTTVVAEAPRRAEDDKPTPNWATEPDPADALTSKLEELQVKSA